MMKNIIFITCAALLLAACMREAGDIPPKPAEGEEVLVRLNLSVAGIAAGDEATRSAAAERLNGPATRVIPSDMNPDGIYDDNYPTIENIWIIQFDGSTPEARMIGAPRFLSVAEGDLVKNDPLDPDTYPLNILVPLVEVTSGCYTLFVANIRQGSTYNWNLTTESTFANVMTRLKTIQNESGSYEDFSALPDGSRTLLMSAVTTGPVTLGTMLEPVFSRNVAKITLNLSLANPDMSIASVRIRNVSNSIIFADAALQYNGVSDNTVFPVDASLIDYTPITDPAAMPAFGQTRTFSWYVPRNQQGVDTRSASFRQKTFFAPVNATYIEIVAVKNGSDTNTSIFRIYPGADMIGDFNLTSNHEYTVGLNVVDIGTDPGDSRVQTFSNLVDYSGYGTPGSRSNSFIVNPAPSAGGGNRTYLVGVHQVNRFWGGSKPGYGNNPANTIKEGEPWVVNLIWCDLPGLFSTDGSPTGISLMNNNGTGVGVGTGPDQAFALNVPPNLPAGNFVIGLKKPGGDYLWSWHFWVTDYAPDNFNRMLIDHNTYTYVVPGGQVERLAPGTSGNNNELLWTPTGFYADRVMMDRYLGAVENYFSTVFSITSRGMLHYQFGRKDPMPGRVTLVTDPANPAFIPDPLLGVVLVNGAAVPVSIAKSVTTPWIFYGINGNWASDANETDYLWNDPDIINFAAGKSIYDPCPPGWKMPILGTWLDFLRTIDSQYVTVLNMGRDLGYASGRGMGTADVPIYGLRYWPGTTLDAPVGGRIWYPAMGGRNAANATANAISGSINLWVATPSSASNANSFSGGSTSTSLRGAVRAAGYPARCISDDAQ